MEVALTQVKPGTKEIVDVLVEEANGDRMHTFSSLPIGYEYYGKERIKSNFVY